MDVPKLAAANRSSPAVVSRERVFLATVPPRKRHDDADFCQDFAAMTLADSYMASVAVVFADRNAGATLEVRLAFQTC
ncbi:hypothetical protein HLI18_08510 [Rhizobium laguerreae]|uniref:hypothetical protein n=1 Tax=Rhizobium TaxID=379 RepID=UPI001478B3C2|nr:MULTISPECIES: hypothetical protein [Rhizobium]MBY5367454.1 hypothetical protein [Rhizobium leguminosarum]MBY5449900.1 hypothetical protein [Rhizobium leguminosarum]NNG69960.1 hypothetical protein [Rhizobium laguerreae]